MPYSIVHSELAFETKDLFGYNEEEFQEYIVGNIFVDCPHLLNEQGYPLNRSTSHYYREAFYESEDFSEIFSQEEGLKTPFYTGYYFHLLTDKVWRDSTFVANAYVSSNEEKLYQISRKLYAYRDYLNLIEDPLKKHDIEKVYSFSFGNRILPAIYKNIPKEVLNTTLYGILDFMLLKKIFVKKIEKESDYEIKNGVFCLRDLSLQKKVEDIYPYSLYQKLKKEALDQFQSKMRS